jgi:multiple sugar transport system permease protein
MKRRRFSWGTVARIPLYIWAATMMVPFYWMLIGSFKPVPELTRYPPTFIVDDPSTDAFYDPQWTDQQQTIQRTEGLFQRYDHVPLGFGRFVLNSLFISTSITILSLLAAALAAYALTKLDIPGRRTIFLVVVGSMMIPWQVTLIPNFLLVKDLPGLGLDTFQAYIIPAIPKAFVVFFLVQFLRSIPDELIYAGRVDGAGEWRIWWRIVMPLLRPALAAMAIFVVIAEWNNFIWPLIIVRSDSMRNLPVALANLNSAQYSAENMGVFMAAALISSLPTIIFFLVFQKHFTRGIALSGIKG